MKNPPDVTPAKPVMACEVCHLVQCQGPAPPGAAYDCVRCGARLGWFKPAARSRTAWLVLGALIVYVPAMVFPIASVVFMGNYNQFNIVQAAGRLYQSQQYFIGTFFVLGVLVAPALQLLGWGVLGFTRPTQWIAVRRLAHRVVQYVNLWSLNEIFLVSLLVGIVKFGDVAVVHTGTGAVAFGLLVALSKAAAGTFEASALWESNEHQESS